MSRRFLIALLICSTLPAFAARRRATVPRDVYPPCSIVTGTAAVTFTRDDGRFLARSTEPRKPIAYTYGLAAMLDEPDTLMAWHNNDLLVSTDGGCAWRVVATIEGWDFPPKLEPARGGRVYAWAENRLFFVRYDARGAVKLKPPVEFVGVGVDAENGDRVRAGGADGTLWESLDAGESWTQFGRLTGAPLFYRFTFDPRNLDHIVAGTVTTGAHVTFDGGRNWSRASGVGAMANVFNLIMSPVDPNRVWAMGIDLSDSGRHIFVSDDGGVTYRIVITEAPGVKLINGPIMAAHPVHRDVLYFAFGTHVFDYGSDLFRFDLATNTLTMTHSDHDGINAITFSRRNPSV
ncbi:MAG TPA: dispase autolysis-inducing protein, partial [Thermoanaerobaculia bacterium]|nr:dispase autolysis-inducing protein [Thermoanaerobaculia bacterium]